MRDIQIRKEEVKPSLYVDGMTLYIKNPKDSTKKLLYLINKFRKAAAYKINIQKSVAHLHTDNKLSEKEIKKTILFTMASEIITYLGENLSKELKFLYI